MDERQSLPAVPVERPGGPAAGRVRRQHTPVARQRGGKSWAEHRDLVTALVNRDERPAERLVRGHTERTRRSDLGQAESPKS
ncbi:MULTISPECIES: hypothetical protein [unclassified Streptomyces]|uniref:hypothetical protein n=1 Tax=unclassified Streptomyces TaxID=2593676 RepID=UPI00114D2E4A